MTRREYTFSLAGLLEGPVPPDGTSVLNQWEAHARSEGLPLTVSTDGSLFSVIPETEEFRDWTPRAPVHEILEASVNALMDKLPAEDAKQCMCTLRSVEVLPGIERQTLYMLGPGSTVVTEQRDVDAQTRPPPSPRDPRATLRTIAISAAAIGLLFLISLPFVPYREWAGRAKENLFRTPAEELKIDPGPFSDLLHPKQVTWDPEKKQYKLEFTPTALYRERERDWREWDQATLRDILALEDILRGTLTLHLLDGDGKILHRVRVDLRAEKDLLRCWFPPAAGLKQVRLSL